MQLTIRGDRFRARDALGVLLILPHFASGRKYYRAERIIREIGQKARRAQYQGDWMIIKEILEKSNFQSWIETWRIIMPNFSSEDWFGNIVPLLKASFRKIKYVSDYVSVEEDTRPVNRPQRKRGYTDKGSRRPENALCWFIPDSEDTSLELPKYKTVKNHQWFNHLRC